MADVRSLLRNERASRRITHQHATYSTTGTLICLICNLQLKSDSLWNGHLRSSQHLMKLQRMKDERPSQSPEATDNNHKADGRTRSETDDTLKQLHNVQSKKRKADDSDEEEENARKRNKSGALPEGFFDESVQREIPPTPSNAVANGNEIKLPSRPATPAKTPEIGSGLVPPKVSTINEDEWAAFEAEIAATEVPFAEEAVISAPAMSAAELAAKSREERSAQRKERQEAEIEGDKEDAARKLEEEFEEMGELEERVRKLKEKREALRAKEAAILQSAPPPTEAQPLAKTAVDEEDEDDEEEEDEDDWAGFRFKS